MKKFFVDTNTIQIFFVTLILSAVFMAAYFFLFQIIRNGSEIIAQLNADKELQLQLKQRYLSNRSFLNSIISERAELDSYFVSEDDIVTFLEDVEVLGKKTGTTVTVDSVSEDEKLTNDTMFGKLNISIQSTGSWQGSIHTLSLLESMPKSVTIRSARISVASGGEEQIWRGVYEVAVDTLK